MLTRRHFCQASLATLTSQSLLNAAQQQGYEFRYLVGSSMYGYTALEEILPEVSKTGATAIDIWPKVHGNQREQIEEMGEEAFAKLLETHGVSLGCLTQYKLGPFNLPGEMRFAERFGCKTIVTGGKGPKGLKGSELKAAVKRFCLQMFPHLQIAKQHGVTVAIENHANNLIESPDSLKWLAEFDQTGQLGIALAPYHLEQNPKQLADLVKALGEKIHVFYAWQHGMGSMQARPKEQELLQMPGRGELNFGPIVEALEEIQYTGWMEIFMHPYPRGIPILETTADVTAEINRSRAYLEGFLKSSK